MHEPEFYKLVTTVICDDDSKNIYTVPVGRCNKQKSVEESKYEEKSKSALNFSGESISKKEPSKIPEKKTMRLYIVSGAPTLLYQHGNQNSCIISSLASSLHYMGDGYVSEYMIRRKKRSLLEIQNKGRMHFCRDILMGHHKEKSPKDSIIVLRNGIHPCYMIFCNQSAYPTVSLLLDRWHRNNHFITVCGKWIFDSNSEVAFPLTQEWLNYTCRGNDTDVLNTNRAVPLGFV